MKYLKYFLFLLIIQSFLISGCSDETTPVTPPEEHFEPEGWLIRDETLNPVLVVFQGEIQKTWNGTAVDTVFRAPYNILSDHYSVKFLNANKEIINPPTGTGYSLGVVITDTSVAGYVKDTPTDWAFHLMGKKYSSTTVELQLIHGNHADVKTPKIPVIVVEDTAAHGKVVGVRLSNADGSGTIFTVSGSEVTGSFEIKKDSTSRFLKVEFLNSSGIYFQPDNLPHGLQLRMIDPEIAESWPADQSSLWLIQIKGKQPGYTSLNIGLLLPYYIFEAEYTSPELPIHVIN